jgi:ATP-binding protein involved in chromosome partitioning
MFEKMNLPIIGIIENMSYFIDPGSNHKTYIFGQDGGKSIAKEKNIKFLGEIPIDPRIMQSCENSKPFVLDHQNTPYDMITENIKLYLQIYI